MFFFGRESGIGNNGYHAPSCAPRPKQDASGERAKEDTTQAFSFFLITQKMIYIMKITEKLFLLCLIPSTFANIHRNLEVS